MAVTYGFFNSLNGDRTYNADQMSRYFDGLISNGVYESIGGGLQVLASSGMTVNVSTGRAIIDCKWLHNDAALALTITAANASLNRYTAVVARLDVSNRQMLITTKDGTAASSPVKPAMTNTSTIKELCLAYIYVAAGTTSITQAEIEDTRASSACGWVTGLIKQVDTSALFIQWQTAYQQQYAAFEEWFADLTEELNIDTFIRRYTKKVTLAGSSTIISLDMTGYEYSNDDIIDVYINGLLGDPESDYTLSISGAAATVTPVATAAGTVIEIHATKSLIGSSSLI